MSGEQRDLQAVMNQPPVLSLAGSRRHEAGRRLEAAEIARRDKTGQTVGEHLLRLQRSLVVVSRDQEELA